MYHAIVIEESLKDKSILDKYSILRTKVSERWHLHVIEVENPSVFIEDIQNEMVTSLPYYFHLYDDKNDLKVAFKEKSFDLDSKDKTTWIEAQKYGGNKLHIPFDELDFSPNNFSSEDEWYNKD